MKCLSLDSARRRRLVFHSCLSEKHVYRGCQSTDEPEGSEGESSRTGNSRLNINSHKCQIVVSNVTQSIDSVVH